MTNQIVYQNFGKPGFRVKFFMLTNIQEVCLGTVSLATMLLVEVVVTVLDEVVYSLSLRFHHWPGLTDT